MVGADEVPHGASQALPYEDAENLECDGESNHGLCSTRNRSLETFDRGPPKGSDRQRGGIYACGRSGG